MLRFSVCYEVITPESAEHGDAEERGFIVKDVSLRDALENFNYDRGYVEPSCYPIDWEYPYTWFSKPEFNHNYITGATETRSLHMPEKLTASSRRRIARMIGC